MFSLNNSRCQYCNLCSSRFYIMRGEITILCLRCADLVQMYYDIQKFEFTDDDFSELVPREIGLGWLVVASNMWP